MAESYRKSLFSFVRNHHTVLQSGCTVLRPHQRWVSVPVAPHPCPHLVSSLFWILAVLTGSLVASRRLNLQFPYVEQLFMCLFAVCISSLVRCVFRSFAHFLIRLFTYCWNGRILCIFWIKVQSRYIFFQFVACLLILSIQCVFCRAEVLNFNEVHLINYFFHGLSSVLYLKCHRHTPGHLDFLVCYLLVLTVLYFIYLLLNTVRSFLFIFFIGELFFPAPQLEVKLFSI